MQLLITEVTEVHREDFCVAGWCATQARMVRPLPRGAHWGAALLKAHGIAPSAVISIAAIETSSAGSYPHRTEDTQVQPRGIRLMQMADPRWLGGRPPKAAPTLALGFQGRLAAGKPRNGVTSGAHVPAGERTASLTAVRIPATHLRFFERGRDSALHLRARLTDGDACYDLAVVAHDLNEIFRTAGIRELNDRLPALGMLHVRLGLARAFPGREDKCFVMINGVYW